MDSEEEVIPKAIVVGVGKSQDPEHQPKTKKKLAFLKNKYFLLNFIVLLGQVWEPIRNWTSDNPESTLVILGSLNVIVSKITGRKLYGDAPDDKK